MKDFSQSALFLELSLQLSILQALILVLPPFSVSHFYEAGFSALAITKIGLRSFTTHSTTLRSNLRTLSNVRSGFEELSELVQSPLSNKHVDSCFNFVLFFYEACFCKYFLLLANKLLTVGSKPKIHADKICFIGVHFFVYYALLNISEWRDMDHIKLIINHF